MRKQSLLLLASALLGATLSNPALANDDHSQATIRLTARPYIDRGMSREMVREMFGAPSAQLSADVWVYFDFKPVNAMAARGQAAVSAEKHDTLIVGFKDGHVSLIRACDSQPVRAFIASQAKRPAPALVATK
jgi:hypothetical protein